MTIIIKMAWPYKSTDGIETGITMLLSQWLS